MNRQEIRNKVRKMLGETTEAFWTNAEINIWIDDACNDIAMHTLCLKGNATLTSVVNTAEYTLSSQIADVLAIVSEAYYMDGSTYEKLQPTTVEELDFDYPGWRSASAGTPFKYYWNLQENIHGLYPKPDATNAGAYWLVKYVKRHANISSDTETVDIPLELHPAIIEQVVATGLETRGQREQAGYHLAKFTQMLVRWKAVNSFNQQLDDDIIMIPGGR